MIFEMTHEHFVRALRVSEKGVGKNPALPILSSIHLEAKAGTVIFSATNLEIGVVCTVPAKVEEEGSIAVSTSVLSNFVSGLPEDQNVHVRTQESYYMKLSSGSYSAQISGFDPKEFPVIPQSSSPEAFSMSTTEFRSYFSPLLVSYSSNQMRPELTGVVAIFSENSIRLASTDSFRLFEVLIPGTFVTKGEGYSALVDQTLIIPGKTLAEIVRLFGDDDETVSLSFSDNQVFFTFGSVTMVSRLLEGTFPDYRQIIPSQFHTTLTVPYEEFVRAVKLSTFFSTTTSSEVRVVVSPEKKDEVLVCAQSSEKGENTTILSGAVSGGEQDVVLNPRYISDGVTAFSGDYVSLSMNDASSPVMINVLDANKKKRDGFTYIVMPIRK